MGSIDLILEVFQVQNHGQTRQANSNLEGAYFLTVAGLKVTYLFKNPCVNVSPCLSAPTLSLFLAKIPC